MHLVSDNHTMKRIVIGCLIIGFAALFSCSSTAELTKEGESLVLVYVEEIHKPVIAPEILLHVEGMDKPLRFSVKAPAATAAMPATERALTTGWSAKGKATVDAPGNFEFSVVEGAVTLLPYKITLVSSSQVEIRELTELDIEYARGQFAMNEDLQNLEIVYPEPVQ